MKKLQKAARVEDQGRAIQAFMDLVSEQREEAFLEDFYRDLAKNMKNIGDK